MTGRAVRRRLTHPLCSISVEMRVMVGTIRRSLSALTSVTVLALGLYFIFGVLGVHLFAGRLSQCSDPGTAPPQSVTGMKWVAPAHAYNGRG